MVRTGDLSVGKFVVINDMLFKVTEIFKMNNGLFSWTAYGLYNYHWMTTAADGKDEVEEAVTEERNLTVKEVLENGDCIMEDTDNTMRTAAIPPEEMVDHLQWNLIFRKPLIARVIFWRDGYVLESFVRPKGRRRT